MYGCESWTVKNAEHWRIDAFELWSWRRLLRDPTSPFWRRSALGFLWKEWCWSWNSSTLATSCEELTHWKRLWCWEGLGAGGEGGDRGWDGWMASRTRWTWVWVNSGRWWWTGRPGVLWLMGSQRVGHDWGTELKWVRWNKNQTVLSSAVYTLDRDIDPLEGATAGSWSLGIVEQSQDKGWCWQQRDRLRGCEGGDCGGKCLWRKAR